MRVPSYPSNREADESVLAIVPQEATANSGKVRK